MKLKRHILSAIAVALSLVLAFALVACGGSKDPKITAIAVDPTSQEMYVGDDPVTLKVNATYDDDTTARIYARDGVTFESSEPTIASVSASGAISALAYGEATITAKVGDLSASCEVTVHSLEIVISGEGVEDGELEMDVDDEVTLSAVVKIDGEVAQGETVEWSSSDAGLVNVGAATGALKALNPGTVTITAKRVGGAQTATVEVTVSEIEGSAKVGDKEQNKSVANTWGYWGDQGWNWSNTTISAAYSEPYVEENPEAGYQFIEAGKMNLTYTIDSFKTGPNDSSIQLFYRSSKDNDGYLEPNHNYTVKLTIVSNYAGKAVINPYDDNETGYIMNEGNEDNHTVELEANVPQEVEVTFRHGDSGAIYAQGKYTNVESALMILLGLVGGASEDDLGNPVKVTVYNIQFKDLGASTYQWVDDPTELDGYTPAPLDPNDFELGEPILPDNTSIIFSGENDPGAQNNTWMAWYVQDTSWGCGDVVTPEDTNTGWTLDDDELSITFTGGSVDFSVQLFYKNTELAAGKQYLLSATVEVSADVTVKLNGNPFTLTEGEHQLYVLVLGKNTAFSMQVPGQDSELTVTVSGVQWQEVLDYEEPVVPELDSDTVTLSVEDDKLYYIITVESETELTQENVKFNLQENPYVLTGDWGGDWTTHTFTFEISNEGNVYTIKFDITDLINGVLDYTTHFEVNAEKDATKEADKGGPADFKIEDEGELTVTFNGYTVTLVSVPGSDDGAEFWGCVGLSVRQAPAE